MRITPSITAILVLFGVVAFLNILAYPTPEACLAMATNPIMLLAAVTSARAGDGALATLDIVEVYEFCLCILLWGLVLICQLDLDQRNCMELVMPVPPGVGYGLKRVRCLVGHRHGFRCACVPFIEVELLGSPPVVLVCVGLDRVLELALPCQTSRPGHWIPSSSFPR